jgi:hypothetical protein
VLSVCAGEFDAKTKSSALPGRAGGAPRGGKLIYILYRSVRVCAIDMRSSGSCDPVLAHLRHFLCDSRASEIWVRKGLENLNQKRKRHGKSNGKDDPIMQLPNSHEFMSRRLPASNLHRTSAVRRFQNKGLHSLAEANAY